jgi:hypothetical protein
MRVRWVFLPVLGAALAHAPVLRFDLLEPLKRPIDGGATFRGRRVFGENKTWRGAVAMFGGVLAATHLLWGWNWYRERMPAQLRHCPPTAVGALLGASVVAGELPNSFVKRQLDIPPGEQRSSPVGLAISLFDQADFVLTAWFLLRPVYRMSAREAIDVSLTVAAVHLPINLVGYALGARTSPI